MAFWQTTVIASIICNYSKVLIKASYAAAAQPLRIFINEFSIRDVSPSSRYINILKGSLFSAVCSQKRIYRTAPPLLGSSSLLLVLLNTTKPNGCKGIRTLIAICKMNNHSTDARQMLINKLRLLIYKGMKSVRIPFAFCGVTGSRSTSVTLTGSTCFALYSSQLVSARLFRSFQGCFHRIPYPFEIGGYGN